MYSRTPEITRDSSHRIGSGSRTGPLDYESRDPIPDPETLPIIKPGTNLGNKARYLGT